uniref:Putative RxLR effector n=1 Tax=Plasmopara viticola TaxID=143451 RepID=A0A650FFY5_PLAVT|nr:putative RxLR effector [Plasmopara viticola]
MYLPLYVRVLTVVALIASVDASSVNRTELIVKKSNAALGLAPTPVTRDEGFKRPLGDEQAVNDDTNGEDRFIGNIFRKNPGKVIDKPLGPVKPHEVALEAQINHWLGANLPLDEVFNRLAYGKTRQEEFLAKTVLPFYIAYSQATALKRGSQDIYGVEVLLKKFWRDDLVRLLNLGLNNRDEIGRDTARKISIGLVDWYYRKNYEAEYVANMLQGDQPILHRVHAEVIESRYNPKKAAGTTRASDVNVN